VRSIFEHVGRTPAAVPLTMLSKARSSAHTANARPVPAAAGGRVRPGGRTRPGPRPPACRRRHTRSRCARRERRARPAASRPSPGQSPRPGCGPHPRGCAHRSSRPGAVAGFQGHDEPGCRPVAVRHGTRPGRRRCPMCAVACLSLRLPESSSTSTRSQVLVSLVFMLGDPHERALCFETVPACGGDFGERRGGLTLAV
jgi:hypothetical protein